MKILNFVILLLLVVVTSRAQSPADWVNPVIGSSNYGTTNPGAVVPNGMVSVTPFNVTGSPLNKFDKDAQWWSTPFSSDNRFCTGFTHVNLSGVGCPDLGVVLLMPTTGKVEAEVEKYGSVIRDQKAVPGYYKGVFEKYNIQAEVTATERVGLSRFRFPAGQSNVLINLGVGLTNESGAMVRVVNNQEIEGFRMTGNFCYNQSYERPVYFVARLNKPAAQFGVWKKMPELKAEGAWSSSNGVLKYYPGYSTAMAGDSIGAYMSFDFQQADEVMVKVGISYVSIENARQNLNFEMPGFAFDEVRGNARDKWNEALSKIEIEGGTDEQRTIFYTALYHTLIHPNVLSDVNGQYPAMDSYRVVENSERPRYTVFSLWDTYRNVHPLFSLVYPQMQLDMVHSMIDMYKESGWLPKWELNSTETHVMEGDPSIPVIVDTYLRGLRGFDVETAYAAMVKSATVKGSENKLRPDIDHYLSHGYVPIVEQFDNSVSHALEYYIADWNLAQFAKALGKKEDHKRFLNQSLRYKTYFDSETMMFRPKKADGSFLVPFDPLQGQNFEPVPGFHEGNAWQYSFYVPHDIKGLMQLQGGSKAFVNRLQRFFDEDLYDMANEPDINNPYLFNYVKGEEWRTQKQVTRLLKQYYKNAPAGLPGNDDCGTLSTWALFSMMGFYPVCPGDMDYALTSPVFDRITIHLDTTVYAGNKIVISKQKSATGGEFIKEILVNGKKHNKFFLGHAEMVKGTHVEFTY